LKLRHECKKLEHAIKKREEVSSELHMIDFEQLKIENQSLNEKIEERNEELLKLRKKTTSTVQVLTHLKEKLQFVQVGSTLFSSLSQTELVLRRQKIKYSKRSSLDSRLNSGSTETPSRKLSCNVISFDKKIRS
jgi:CRISPR/Cas system CMR subunit Cmr4 (Cas7 group RAMP superfamily)